MVDLDIVNPYFRSSDYVKMLENRGIQIIAPALAGTTLDVPSISPEVSSVFDSGAGQVIFDAGGDAAGSRVLGRFYKGFSPGETEMLFVINRFRAQIANPADAGEILREIEEASRLKATGIVNNTHLCGLTTVEDVISSDDYAQEVCRLSGLPLVYTAVEKRLLDTAGENPSAEGERIKNPFPLEILVRTPWQTKS